MAAAQSKPGGRRPGQGRPSAFKADQENLQAAALEYLQDPKRAKVVVQTLYDFGTGGGRVMAKKQWTPAGMKLVVGEEECKLADGSTVWLYELRPDPALLKTLAELTLGRAPTRALVQQDTEIRVVTGVPRGRPAREVEEEDEEE